MLERFSIFRQLMIRFIAMCLVLTVSLSHADAGVNELTAKGIDIFTNAYRVWDGPQFNDAVEVFQKACDDSSATVTNFYWLGAAQFHRALYLLGLPDSATNKSGTKEALDAAAMALTRAVQLDENQAECHALLGTIYGMQMSNNWMWAAWLGPRLQKELKLAMTLGKNNPRVQYLLGTSQFYCATQEPARRAALMTLLRAEKLFDIEKKLPVAFLKPRWGHDSCLTFIGSCYEKLGHLADAEEYFRKALVIHPENGLAQLGLAGVIKNKK